jgi:hypothetical protein
VELCPQCGWPHDAPIVESEESVVSCQCGWQGRPRDMLAIAGEVATKHMDLMEKMVQFHMELAKTISPSVARLLLSYRFVDPKKPSVTEFAKLLKTSTNAACAVIFKQLFTPEEGEDAESRREVH